MVASTQRRAAVALGWALALSACKYLSTTVFRQLTYAPGGATLVLSANDGVYLAHPTSDSPIRATDRDCAGPGGQALSCARMSADGRRVALLTAAKGASGGFDLDEVQGNGSRGIPADALSEVSLSRVASGVLDADFSPDGAELVFAQAGDADGVVSLKRLAPLGAAVELVHAVKVEAGAERPLAAASVGSFGVAYPRPNAGAVELWYQPFDGGQAQALGTLPLGCSGTGFSGCVTRSPDGASFFWQEKDGGVFHLFREQKQVDLPLGAGYGLAFSASGSFLLRMEGTPAGASVTSADTAAVVRRVWNAASGELSSDGESLAYLAVESQAKNTARLYVGASRHGGADQDFGVFEAPAVHPMATQAMGSLDVVHTFTGDGRFVIVTAKADDSDSAKLVAVEVDTGVQRELGTLACNACCSVAPAGALVACAPGLAGATGPVAVDLYDPATGLKTAAADAAADVQPLSDGSGLAVLNIPTGQLPDLRVVTRDGKVTSLGTALGFAASPTAAELAVIDLLGKVSAKVLP